MAVMVFLPPSLQSLVGGQRQIAAEGKTVGDCLDQIIRLFPSLKEAIFGPGRNLNRKLSILVNAENTYPEQLKKAVKDGDKLYIMDILVGG
jgi:sulfur-carrier protein